MAGEGIITVVGRVKADPELKHVGANQTPVTNFSIAQQSRVKDKRTDQWTDGDTTWYDITAWREQAENIVDQVRKGDSVIVHGRLAARKFDKQDGSQGTSLTIQIDTIGLVISPFKPKATAQQGWAAAPTYDENVPF